MDLGSMSDGELRRAHAMFVANPDAFAENPEYMHALVREYARRFSAGNVEADLNAAATPIPAEPVLQPGRKRSRADWAVDATTAGGLYSPSENVDAMRVGDRPSPVDVTLASASQGMTPPGYDAWAEAMTDAETGTTRAQRQAQAAETGRRIDRQAATYNRDTGLAPPEDLEDSDGPYPGAGRPGYDRTLTFDEVMASREQAEAERAARMRPMLDAAKRDMKARAQWREDNPAQAESLAVGQRERSDDYRKERLLYRMAEQTGMSIEELRANNPQFSSVGQIPARDGAGIPTLTRTKDGMQLRTMPTSTSSMRDAAAAQRIADKKARAETWKAQAMLAGGQPTGGPRGTKATLAAWNALGQEGLNDWQRLTMAKALRPDIDGTSPLTVEANSAKNAMRLINADMIGQGGLGSTREQMMRDQRRGEAYDFAKAEHDKMFGPLAGPMGPEDARRLKRRVAARFGEPYADVVDALPINDGAATPAAPPAGYPGAAPSPPPSNPLAAPRPYG